MKTFARKRKSSISSEPVLTNGTCADKRKPIPDYSGVYDIESLGPGHADEVLAAPLPDLRASPSASVSDSEQQRTALKRKRSKADHNENVVQKKSHAQVPPATTASPPRAWGTIRSLAQEAVDPPPARKAADYGNTYSQGVRGSARPDEGEPGVTPAAALLRRTEAGGAAVAGGDVLVDSLRVPRPEGNGRLPQSPSAQGTKQSSSLGSPDQPLPVPSPKSLFYRHRLSRAATAATNTAPGTTAAADMSIPRASSPRRATQHLTHCDLQDASAPASRPQPEPQPQPQPRPGKGTAPALAPRSPPPQREGALPARLRPEQQQQQQQTLPQQQQEQQQAEAAGDTAAPKAAASPPVLAAFARRARPPPLPAKEIHSLPEKAVGPGDRTLRTALRHCKAAVGDGNPPARPRSDLQVAAAATAVERTQPQRRLRPADPADATQDLDLDPVPEAEAEAMPLVERSAAEVRPSTRRLRDPPAAGAVIPRGPPAPPLPPLARSFSAPQATTAAAAQPPAAGGLDRRCGSGDGHRGGGDPPVPEPRSQPLSGGSHSLHGGSQPRLGVGVSGLGFKGRGIAGGCSTQTVAAGVGRPGARPIGRGRLPAAAIGGGSGGTAAAQAREGDPVSSAAAGPGAAAGRAAGGRGGSSEKELHGTAAPGEGGVAAAGGGAGAGAGRKVPPGAVAAAAAGASESRRSGSRASLSAGGGGAGGSAGGGGGKAEPAAHSIVEAQECGEMLQLQDDAQYALDGLKAAAAGSAGASGGAAAAALAREPLTALATMLATRRGRAALSRPTNMAQQALTSAARASVVQRDPLAALAAAVILLALVQEDALPAYGASYAAAVLMRQVLQQADQDPPPLLRPPTRNSAGAATAVGAAPGGASGSGPGLAPSAGPGPASAWALIQHVRGEGSEGAERGGSQVCGRGGAGGSGSAGSSAGCVGAADEAVTKRLLRLVTEGPLSRQVGRPDLVREPLPVVLLAMISASETDKDRIQFVERLKANMLKVGLLPLLGGLVTTRRDALVRHRRDEWLAAEAVAAPPPPAAAPGAAERLQVAVLDAGGDAEAAPAPVQAADGDGDGGGIGPDGTAAAAVPVSAAAPGDPYNFNSTPTQPLASQQPDPALSQPPNAPVALPTPTEVPAPPPPLPGWLFWELFLLLRVLENATFTHPGNENALLALKVAAEFPVPNAEAAEAAAATATAAGVSIAGAGGAGPGTGGGSGGGGGDGGGGSLGQLAASQPEVAEPSQSLPFRMTHSEPQPSAGRWEGSQPSLWFGSQPGPAVGPGGSQSGLRAGSQTRQGAVTLGVGLSQPLSQPTLELMEATVAETDGTGGRGGASFAAVLVDIVRELSALPEIYMRCSVGTGADPGGTGACRGGARAAGATTAATAAAATMPAPTAMAVCRICTAVLMNLTHEHPDGVAAVAAAGGLHAVGGLLWRCCRPRLETGTAEAEGAKAETEAAGERHGGGGGGGGGPSGVAAGEGQRQERLLVVVVSQSTIVDCVEVLSVGLGLLINVTSKSPQNQRTLRNALLTLTDAPTGITAAASAASDRTIGSQPPGGLEASGAATGPGPADGDDGAIVATAAGGRGRMVPLLCAILNAMTPPARQPIPASAVAGCAGDPAGSPVRHSTYGMPDNDNAEDDLSGSPEGVSGDDGPKQRTAGEGPAGQRGGGAGSPDSAGHHHPDPGRREEVTEAALAEDQQGSQVSMAQVYSAILLGYLIAGDDEDDGDGDGGPGDGDGDGKAAEGAGRRGASGGGGGCSASEARVEARRLLAGGTLRPVTSRISRCLDFYCRTGTITESTKALMTALLKRLLSLELLENPPTAAPGTATAATAPRTGP